MPDRKSVLLFATICATCVGTIAWILASSQSTSMSFFDRVNPGDLAHSIWSIEGVLPPRIYYRHTGIDMQYGQLAYVEAGQPGKTTFVNNLSCDTVHAAGDKGLCLHSDRGLITTYEAFVFDTDTHEIIGKFGLGGTPSRTRVSPDGKYGATTVFVTGHGYDTVSFSTQTMLVDMASATPIVDLEDFAVTRDGEGFRRDDFNFWGVTFTQNSQSFFATLSTGGEHLLVHGDVSARTAEVVRANVECPSVSPDGTHLAYKRRNVIDGNVVWALHVLEVGTLRDVELVDERNIDDQLEWLDNDRVLYSVPDTKTPAITQVWMANADGTGEAETVLDRAYSPAVLRWTE